MSIHFGSGKSFAEVDLDRVSGQPGLGHVRLLVSFKAHVRGQPQDTQTQIGGFAGDLLVQGHSGQLGHVAALHPFNPPFVIDAYTDSHSTSFFMVAELDRGRIESIEDVRAGKDLIWEVRIGAQVNHGGKSQNVGGQLRSDMLGAKWLAILQEAAYRKTLLIEVPIAPSGQRSLQKAMKHLTAALDSMNGGQWRNAVGLCRDAIEAASKTFDGDDSKADFENQRMKSKEERVLVLRRALKLLPHAAKHDDTNEQEITWTRHDAEMTLAMTASLIRWYTTQ